MQTVKEFIEQYYRLNKNKLAFNYPGLREERLLEEFCLHYDLKPNEVYTESTRDFIGLVSQGVPFEYIQKSAYFYRSHFYIDDRVLIPRSETEILIEDVCQFIKKNYHDNFKIAEIGIGSFNIGLSIAMEISNPLILIGGDISTDALEVAAINQFKLKSRIHPETKIETIESDKMQNLKGEFDCIVSNPPYIRKMSDREGVHHQADLFEPHVALYLDDQEFTQWFQELFTQVEGQLVTNGIFFMEGHEDTLKDLMSLAQKYFEHVEIKQDYTQRDRYLHCYKTRKSNG